MLNNIEVLCHSSIRINKEKTIYIRKSIQFLYKTKMNAISIFVLMRSFDLL